MTFIWDSGYTKDIPPYGNFRGMIKDGERPSKVMLTRKDIQHAQNILTETELARYLNIIATALK